MLPAQAYQKEALQLIEGMLDAKTWNRDRINIAHLAIQLLSEVKEKFLEQSKKEVRRAERSVSPKMKRKENTSERIFAVLICVILCSRYLKFTINLLVFLSIANITDEA